MANFREWNILHIFLFVTFVVSGLIINLVQVILFFTVGLLSRKVFRKINFYFNWMINAQILFIGTWWSQSEGILFCETESVFQNLGKESALVTMNHHYEVDWLFGWMGSDNFKVLGNSRVFVKKMIQYVPVVGWSWLMSDVVFLARDWEKDRLKLAQGVDQLCQYPDPMWLLLFAEGTRMNPEKLEASKEFAKKRNLPILKHHLTPRTKGFIETMKSLNKNEIKAVYDVTLVMPSDIISTVSTILVGKKAVGHMFVRRFAISDVPTDEEGMSKFLMDLYKDKDELKENYLKTGSFTDKNGKFPIYKEIKLGYRIPVLLNTLILNTLITIPLLAQLGRMLCSGSMINISLALLFPAVLYFSLKKFINLTRISKASAYGKKKD